MYGAMLMTFLWRAILVVTLSSIISTCVTWKEWSHWP